MEKCPFSVTGQGFKAEDGDARFDLGHALAAEVADLAQLVRLQRLHDGADGEQSRAFERVLTAHGEHQLVDRRRACAFGKGQREADIAAVIMLQSGRKAAGFSGLCQSAEQLLFSHVHTPRNLKFRGR